MNATPTLTPVDGLITVTARYTPTTHIHDIDSIYSRHYWVPEIGPLSYLTLLFLSSWVPADDLTITIDYDEFARSLGTTATRLTRTVQRLVGFHLAYIPVTEPSTLQIRRRLPTLNDRQLARLAQRCPTLAACHDEQLHTAAA